ncbi:MAG: ComEC/Rec2 family competence protein [Polyangiaceae bacterium]|nr:ComEC/Rec2 family competence protein [Polyangiaceae bacterium]
MLQRARARSEGPPRPPRSLSAALLFGVACDPIAIGDVSFTLSTAVMAGLLTLSRPIAHLLGARGPSSRGEVPLLRRAWGARWPPSRRRSRRRSAARRLTALLSAELPLAGLAANLIAAPLGELFALPFAIRTRWSRGSRRSERGAADAASGALRVVLAIARLARDAEPTAPVPRRAACTTSSAVSARRGLRTPAKPLAAPRGVRAALFALGAVELAVRRGPPDGVLEITVLDVGQGDAILVELPEDGAMLMVDAGGLPGQPLDIGERVVAPTSSRAQEHLRGLGCSWSLTPTRITDSAARGVEAASSRSASLAQGTRATTPAAA